MSPSDGDLRVWWIPQIPMKPFTTPVESVDEAALVLRVLAGYDAFQYENNIKPDYCNAGGLEEFDELDDEDSPNGSWVEWYSDAGTDIKDFMKSGATNETNVD